MAHKSRAQKWRVLAFLPLPGSDSSSESAECEWNVINFIDWWNISFSWITWVDMHSTILLSFELLHDACSKFVGDTSSSVYNGCVELCCWPPVGIEILVLVDEIYRYAAWIWQVPIDPLIRPMESDRKHCTRHVVVKIQSRFRHSSRCEKQITIYCDSQSTVLHVSKLRCVRLHAKVEQTEIDRTHSTEKGRRYNARSSGIIWVAERSNYIVCGWFGWEIGARVYVSHSF